MQPIYILEPLSAGLCEIQVPADGRAKVGREATNEFSCPHDLRMSSVHFEIGMETGECRIRDLCSSNGLFLNTKRVTSAIVVEGDEVQAGESRWRLLMRSEEDYSPTSMLPAERLSDTARPKSQNAAPARPQTVDLSVALVLTATDSSSRRIAPPQSLTIGRTELAQWVFSTDGQMSSCHAELTYSADGWVIEDLKSSNGTYVNGSRVDEAKIADRDEIRLGRTRFEVRFLTATPEWSSPVRSNPTQDMEEAKGGWDAVAHPPASVGPKERQRDTREVLHAEDDGLQRERIEENKIEGAELEHSTAKGEENEREEEIEQVEIEQVEIDGDSLKLVDQGWDKTDDIGEDKSLESRTDSPGHEDEQSSPREASWNAPPSSSAIDFLDKEVGMEVYAKQAAELRGVPCRSGLFVYRGQAAILEPVDVCLRLMKATSGWVLNGSEIENWIEAARQGLSGLPREWLNPSYADDASWILAFLGSWGSGNSWLVLARVELDDVLQSLRNLRQPVGGQLPLISSLNTTELAAFLGDGDDAEVLPFFAPIDAILLEVGMGERWEMFARKELEPILQSSGL